MATRRSDSGAAFDHGAQYSTVRDERFQNCVDSWQQAGLVQRWTGRIVSLHDQHTEQEKSSTVRFVACPGMNAICRHLAEKLACGDWLSGPRVEGAFLSGVALAERLLALDI